MKLKPYIITILLLFSFSSMASVTTCFFSTIEGKPVVKLRASAFGEEDVMKIYTYDSYPDRNKAFEVCKQHAEGMSIYELKDHEPTKYALYRYGYLDTDSFSNSIRTLQKRAIKRVKNKMEKVVKSNLL
jgi:hypothetical protein